MARSLESSMVNYKKGGMVLKRLLFLAVLLLKVTVPAYAESKSAMEEYELQERCGKQVAAQFKENYGVGVMDDEDGHLQYDYSNHYNKKMNKCFFILTTIHWSKDKKNSSIFKEMFDFNENKQYGNLWVIGGKTDNCNVLGKFCHSEVEWNALIAPYMNE